ncbi:unnamed protein product [Pleuronectes platessa]|uniref:Uncharacterized protein n=1 Tax=Pleuronectes platessa TaxID=8262 RepID=A0A9N7TRK1_PLEPL|nr:unnamed protein product [Pleuronectes platessa]
MEWMNAEETLRRAETPLFWVGAFTVASLALWLLYRLLSGFRIWVLGNGQLLSPKLGKWAGEWCHSSFPRQPTRSRSRQVDSTAIELKLHTGTERAAFLVRK